MDYPVRVTMLASRFPPCIGGTERQAYLLSRELVRQGAEVHVLTQRYETHLPSKETLDGITIERLPPAGQSRLASLLYVLQGLRTLTERHPPPDILHAHMIAAPAVLAQMLGKRLGCKTLVKVACAGPYGDVATSQRTWYGRRKLTSVLKGMDRVICLTREIEKEVLEAGAPRMKMVRIPNGVDTDHFHPAASDDEKKSLRSQLGLGEGQWILFAGRFTAQKRPQSLLDAFLRCLSAVPEARLLLLGDGPLKESLQMKIRQENVGDKVIMKMAEGTMDPYYRAADLFVLPSAAEGMSNSLLEAMASGLPCIATDAGGMDILEDRRNGLRVHLDQPEMLAQAIQNVLKNPAYARTLGDSGRTTIMESFRMEAVARQYMDLYRQLLQK